MQPDFNFGRPELLLLDRLDYLKTELQFKIRCLGVVFSRVRKHVGFHQETMARLPKEKEFKRLHFFKTVVPENITVSEAPMAAKPVALFDSFGAWGLAFAELAAEVASCL